MPLSATTERSLMHTRNLDMRAYKRDDGLWDIEGHLVDTKPFAYVMIDSSRAPDEPIHDMWLRLTVDRDFVVREAEAFMDVGAHFLCNDVSPAFAALAGLRIGAGWNRAVRERLGGRRGCTHLVEMTAQLATTAMQAIWAEDEADQAAAGDAHELPSGMLDSCYAYRRESEYLRRYFPDHWVDPEAEHAEREPDAG